MEGHREMITWIKNLQAVLDQYDIPGIIFKPKQMMCFEALYAGCNVISVLPTGYGKSIIFQLLADFLPPKHLGHDNIVVVVSPLNSIIEDQMNFLRKIGLKCGALNFKGSTPDDVGCSLFAQNAPNDDNHEIDQQDMELQSIPDDVRRGACKLVFGHPEAFLDPVGRRLLRLKPYNKRVVAIAVDEAHCVEIWYVDLSVPIGY